MKKEAIAVLIFIFSAALPLDAYSAVLINEVLSNGLDDPDSEWVEIYNNDNLNANLTNWRISETSSSNFTFSAVVPANGFIILAGDLETFVLAYPGVRLSEITILNITISNFNLADTGGEIRLYDSSGSLADAIAYAQPSGKTYENVSVGRYPDGSQSFLNLSTLTPGAKNDAHAPKLNKWLNPPSNNTKISALVNVSVNITDDTGDVSSAIVNFNGTNFSMAKSGDVWHFLWGTRLNIQKTYNISIFFNDSYGKSGSDTLFNITVSSTGNHSRNNTAPVITSTPETSAKKGEMYRYDADAFDADNDTLLFSLATNASGMAINSSTGVITFMPASEGFFSVKISVTDFIDTANQSYNLSVEDASVLRISDIKIRIDGGKANNLSNGSEISKDAKIGSDVTFKVTLVNDFPKKDGVKIEDIGVKAVIKGIVNGSDLKAESRKFDLKPQNDKTAVLRLDIPFNASEGTFNVLIEAEGRDKNGTNHSSAITLKLDVKNRKHSLSLTKFELNPNSAGCGRLVKIRYEITNTGQHGEANVFLRIRSKELGLSFIQDEINIRKKDGKNKFSGSAIFKVNKKIDEGSYPITAKVFSIDKKLQDAEKAYLEVKGCVRK